METQKYYSMNEAYRAVYEKKEEGGGVPDLNGVVIGRPINPYRPVQVTQNTVNVDVTRDYVGPGGVEKAYYTYPASFDPTNREDVAKEQKHDGSAKQPLVQKEDIEIIGDYLLENEFCTNPEDVDAFYQHMSEEWKEHIMNEMNVADQMKVSQKALKPVPKGGYNHPAIRAKNMKNIKGPSMEKLTKPRMGSSD